MDAPQARELAARYGDSFYVLDVDRLEANVQRWRAAFRTEYPDTDLSYPYKANNLPAVCRIMADLGLGAEICSPMEWWLTRELGLSPDRVRYGGSGRRAASITEALTAGATIVIDSVRDARIVADAAAAQSDRVFAVELRCTVELPGTPTPRLGLAPGTPQWDEVIALLSGTANLELTGLHCHQPGGDPDEFARRANILVAVADELFPDRPPRYLDVGGGFYGGVPPRWPGPGPEPGPTAYARAIAVALRARYRGDHPTLVIEPGTALVATAMSYVTRVMDTKPGPRRPVAVVAGSLLHTSPNTRRADFPTCLLAQDQADGTFDVAGHTPMPDEWLALDVPGRPREGDFVLFEDVGAYSVSMPTVFMHPRPAVIGHSAVGGYWQIMAPGESEKTLRA